MPSDTEFPFGLALASAFFVALLAFNVGQFADLTGLGTLGATAVLVVVPLALAFVVAVAIRDRLDTRRRRLQFVGGATVLAAMLEVAVVGVAVQGVGTWDIVWLVVAVLLSYVMLRFDGPTLTR